MTMTMSPESLKSIKYVVPVYSTYTLHIVKGPFKHPRGAGVLDQPCQYLH